MDKDELTRVAAQLVAPGKGILASDSSVDSMAKRLEKVGVESTEEARRRFREIFITASGMEEYISGIILFDETLRQSASDGRRFVDILNEKGVLAGIKVDKKAWPMANFPDEKLTEGLDGLRDRLKEYKEIGAKFAKWRGVISIGDGIPTDACIEANAHALAYYAALCQEEGIVPVVEPEVVMNGGHDMERCEHVTYKTLKIVFEKLTQYRVYLGGMILKANMVLPGKESNQEIDNAKVAEKTLAVLTEVVPDEVPGVVFLSGGQSGEDATWRLNEIAKTKQALWEVSFSFERGLQEEALEVWRGDDANFARAQDVFMERAEKVSLARSGELQ